MKAPVFLLCIATIVFAGAADSRPLPSPSVARLFVDETIGVAMVEEEEECAQCESEKHCIEDDCQAWWQMLGEACDPESGKICARCVPTCTAGDSIRDIPAFVDPWYAYHKCSSWSCEPEEQLLAVEAALRKPTKQQVAALAEALWASNGKLRLNTERGLIQVVCDIGVVKQFDLRDKVVTQLAISLVAGTQ